jgi:hypothetical protein
MTHDQTFTLRPDGGYDIQPAGVLLLLGREISTTPPTALRAKLEGYVRAFLQAVRAGGFKKRMCWKRCWPEATPASGF